MTFCEQLNEYMDMTGCTISSLAEASGLSVSVLSRYKNGKRTPAPKSPQLSALAAGICKLSCNKSLIYDEVISCLRQTLDKEVFDTQIFSKKLDELLKALNIHNSYISNKMNYDASFISKIRSGKRTPSDANNFVSQLSLFLFRYCLSENKLEEAAYIFECTPEELSSHAKFSTMLSNYLNNNFERQPTETFDFLKRLDDFSLNDYIKSIHFDDIKIPSAPFHLPKSKNYYGVEGLKEAELSFEKATVLSSSREPVFMYSDMPMNTLVDDVFPKKWMMGLAVMLKKGLQIQIIHSLDRPFHELMLGLEAWIPLYMTGQVQPYYLKQTDASVFRHMLYVSGAAALSGECILGQDIYGKKYVTNNRQELEYYRKRGNDLLDKARPLMEIYRREHRKLFTGFINKMHHHIADRHNHLSGLSLGTLPPELLAEILSSSEFNDAQKRSITKLADMEKNSYEQILKEKKIVESVPVLSEEEFNKSPISLPLGALFLAKKANYTYAQYMAHLNAAREYSKTHKNYSLEESDSLYFHNIQIQVVSGKYALITKTNPPTIHFVIHQPMLVNAIENMIIPIKE